MASEQEEYLAVLKASYDYEPQSEDEIPMKEDQVLFLLERTDEDWWKVKIRGDSSDADTPVGLVPAAYVEQAEHTSVVKALYQYDSAAPGELSIKEDDVLLAFDQEDDWLLVQSEKDGKAGFVPANYVEPSEPEAPVAASALQIVVPPSPPPPVSTYVDPEDRVKATKAKADDIQTWVVSEVDKKGKKKKGTLGIGNGAIFFASESDKTPVQKWQTADVKGITVEKSKHVHIDVGGSASTNLHFNAGSKDTAEAIVTKLESSKKLSGSSPPATPHSANGTSSAPSPAQARRLPPIDGKLSKKKASVHFSLSSPVVIPRREPSEEGEAEPEVGEHAEEDDYHVSADGKGALVIALYDFDADDADELSVKEGEQLTVLEKEADDWWKCRNTRGAEGVVPASYLELADADLHQSAPAEAEHVDPDDSDEQGAEAEAEAGRLAEAERKRTEEEHKKLEAESRARRVAAAAEAENKRRREHKAANRQPASTVEESKPESSSSRTHVPKPSNASPPTANRGSSEAKRPPPPESTRVWHDRTGQFRVEAAFLGFNDGKLRLHKLNGVIVEVPAAKMSVEDLRYVSNITSKGSSSSDAKQPSEDDVPLAVLKSDTSRASASRPTQPKKAPTTDWFEFFLSAGCDLDDCTRYAAAFDRDKIDEAILPDITDATMRSLGLREGDIIRVTKAIQQRKPKSVNGRDPVQEQLRLDEELARQLQAEENGGLRQAAPNIFAGPQGQLKNQRRGRPQPSKSVPPPSVDLTAISTASGHMQRTASPQLVSSSSAPTMPPPRSSSSLSPGGFEDDAWTNRPSSTKPVASAPSVTAARAPSAPPAAPTAPATSTAPPTSAGRKLANKTEADIFDQLARLSDLRTKSPTATTTSVTPTLSPSSSVAASPPVSFQSGLGMGSSPVPIGQHLQTQQAGGFIPVNAPRGPFAPVPANQALLQPLIPTNTAFNSFIPTRPTSTPSFQNTPSLRPPPAPLAPTFLPTQHTGYPVQHPLLPLQTGLPQFTPAQTNPPSLNMYSQSPFNAPPVPPVPPLPPSAPSNTSPANVFAQMKSGTFASGNDSVNPQPADKYDSLRPTMVTAQPTGWGYQNGYQQGGFTGY